jgi:hypothetical protein
MKPRQIVCAFVLSLLLLSFPLIDVVEAQTEVEVKTGPEFSGGDKSKVQGCVNNILGKKFPFGALGKLPKGGSSCPRVVFFKEAHEFCWLIQIWHAIEPGVLIYYLVQIIIHL